jgi:hypothetical protein
MYNVMYSYVTVVKESPTWLPPPRPPHPRYRIFLLNIWYIMDEGTLKTPIPKCRLYWSFLFGVVKQFCWL